MFLSDKLVILLHSSYTATVLLVNNINMLNIYIFHTKIHYEGDCLANVRRIEKGWFFFTLKTAVLLHLSSYCISNSGTATLVNNKNIRRNNYLTLHKSVRSSPDMYGEDTGLFLYKYFVFLYNLYQSSLPYPDYKEEIRCNNYLFSSAHTNLVGMSPLPS